VEESVGEADGMDIHVSTRKLKGSLGKLLSRPSAMTVSLIAGIKPRSDKKNNQTQNATVTEPAIDPRNPPALAGHRLEEPEWVKQAAEQGRITLKANTLVRTDKGTTTLLTKPGTNNTCACSDGVTTGCPCGNGALISHFANPAMVANNTKPIRIVRTEKYARDRPINVCAKYNNCTQPNKEVLAPGQIRARMRRAVPVGHNPKRLIKPESYVSPIYDGAKSSSSSSSHKSESSESSKHSSNSESSASVSKAV